MLKTIFGKKPDGRFPEEKFVVAEGERDGLPAFAIINRAYKDYAFGAEYPWHVQIEITMRHVSDVGLPVDPEPVVLNGMEDAIEDELKKLGGVHYIARQSWNSTRLLDYYVEDGEATGEVLARIRDNAPPREFVFRIERDEAWAICEGFFAKL
jgi:Family of unknown function (DUF695)